MNIQSVIERGKVLGKEEYKNLYVKLGMERFTTEDGSESFWGIPLDEKHFVFANNLLAFIFHNIVGRVGIRSGNKMLRKETVEFFVKADEKGG